MDIYIYIYINYLMNYLSAGVQELIGLHCKLSDPSSGLAMGVQLIHGLQLTGGSLINVYIYGTSRHISCTIPWLSYNNYGTVWTYVNIYIYI